MDPFLVWLESTAFSAWMRESPSLWAFPAILAVHTIGMAFVVGINVAVGLRVLGVASGVPLDELRRFFPLMWLGLGVNAASGLALLVGYPTKALTNPFFYGKLALIALALGCLRSIHRSAIRVAPEGPTVGTGVKVVAVISLVCWGAAVTAGRLLAYTYSRLMATD